MPTDAGKRPAIDAAAYRTFSRHVRRYDMIASVDLPLLIVQDVMRRDLNAKKCSVIESTWKETADEWEAPGERLVSVRYVAGGMRYGLSASVDWPTAPNVVVFPRLVPARVIST